MSETIFVPAIAQKFTFWQKINPAFWIRNDTEQPLSDAPWYHGPDTTIAGYIGPPWEESKRNTYWLYYRNPLQNLRAVVIGVRDKAHYVTGKYPQVMQLNDLNPPQSGWVFSYLHGGDLWIPRPWICYSGKGVFYFGWNWQGFFGAKANGVYPIVIVSLVIAIAVVAVMCFYTPG